MAFPQERTLVIRPLSRRAYGARFGLLAFSAIVALALIVSWGRWLLG